MSEVLAGRLPAEEWAVLRDGSTVHIRAIVAGDKAALAAAFERLSSEARYRRFLAPVEHLSTEWLSYLTEVDHVGHEALVAVEPDDGELVGVSRYVALDEGRQQAEVAVVVADGWRGRGLATVLLAELVTRARAAGVQRFVAVCLAENKDALDVLGSLGPTVISSQESGQRQLSIELSAEDSEAALQRALGHADRGEVTFLPLARTAAD